MVAITQVSAACTQISLIYLISVEKLHVEKSCRLLSFYTQYLKKDEAYCLISTRVSSRFCGLAQTIPIYLIRVQ